MQQARLKTRLRFWLRRNVKRVTPLTWLIWGLLVSDLTAPGYLKFNLVFISVDAGEVIENAIAQSE